MRCQIRITLTAISHAGSDIGDDWSYRVSVGGQPRRAINGQGAGTPGRRYRVRRRWTFYRECGAPHFFDVQARLKEDDLFFSDTETANGRLTISCPNVPGVPVGANNLPVTGSVTEDLGFTSGGTNRVTLHFSISAMCI
jgi:hypothetical protein